MTDQDAIWNALHDAQRAIDEARRAMWLLAQDDAAQAMELLDQATVSLATIGQCLERLTP